MIKIPGMLVSKTFAVLLVFLLLHGPSTFAVGGNAEDIFVIALDEYAHGVYEQAAAKLENALNLKEAAQPGLKAKIYLLLGACYEKSGKEDKAKNHYLLLKGMLTEGSIDGIPGITGVDKGGLTIYREIFAEDSFFEFKEPVAAAEMLKKKVVHAPRKSIAQKEKEKKKKKFPWLIAIGTVVIIGTAVVLLLPKKDNKIKIPEIEWIKIPAGEFWMGDNFNEGDADEQPVHKVYLDEYYISKYEITRQEFFAFCDAVGRPFHQKDPRYNYDVGNYPVSAVSRMDAVAFCEWLSARTGEKIDLPTEAQWEKAARGDLQYRYPWGNTAPDCQKAFFSECSGNGIAFLSRIRPVGLLGAGKSPYGVYDMAGNVAEWCRDSYSATYYSLSPGINPTGPVSGNLYVVRGGDTYSNAPGIRSANRGSREAGYIDNYLGFRIVKENQ